MTKSMTNQSMVHDVMEISYDGMVKPWHHDEPWSER